MSSAILDAGRAGLAKAVRDRIAGPRFQAVHDQIWHTPGPRWFDESDAIWIVHADSAMIIGGIRALLLQSLHPVAMFGVVEHSGFRGDPWGRLQRTSRFIATTTYGSAEAAENSISRVKAIHGRVSGTTGDGVAYRADDPHLLAWIHAAEVDSFLSAHRWFGADPLDDQQADEYVRQTAKVAALLGVLDPPTTVAELDALIQSYRPELAVTAGARDARDLLLKDPPISGPARAGYAALASGAVSLLPSWSRRMLSLPTLPVTDRLLARPLARLAVTAIRWSLAGGGAV